jgi:hypothetical protein
MGGDGKTRELLRAWSEAPASAAILTDIDGTLAPIVPTPDMSEVPAEIVSDADEAIRHRYRTIGQNRYRGE